MQFNTLLFITLFAFVTMHPIQNTNGTDANCTKSQNSKQNGIRDNPNSTHLITLDYATGDETAAPSSNSTQTKTVEEPNILVRAKNKVVKTYQEIHTKASALYHGLFGGTATVYDGSDAQTSSAQGNNAHQCILVAITILYWIT
jgi:hypothetical protein